LGEIKVQESRGAAGHKGVQSIINHLGINDFNRIRIGIKPEKNNIETEKFVMQKFTNDEEEVLKEIIERAAQITIATL
ncbi:aminoacyl-tRNA hydrolase, partial [Patescibacteria group bacterium]|nr:aminoacyl-tRNA hydrolase [Patescibacteria group bacterium]